MTALEPAALRLLATLLRSRPATRAELRKLRARPDDADRLLDQLIRAGFIGEEDDGRLSYRSPDRVVEEQARGLADLVGLLPELSREWRQGTGDRTTLDVELVHGHEEQWRAWARHAALTPPRAPLNLYPSLDVLGDLIVPELPEVTRPYPDGMGNARAILPASVVVTAEDRRIVDGMVAAGMRVRLARHVATWLYSDPEVLCALPVVWGEHPPTSIMICHDPAVRALAAAYAEGVWISALPYRQPRPEWPDVLRMLALGLSDRAIATAHGTSQRTVERRIAEAMAHYGVGTRFELGMTWSAKQVDEG
ncbi:hypothetical protein BJ973_002680 [Actinoplanes tereljensis]|uniref:HTH luxR-type domain-containing protein n=1 Tax=Paractinoplanes tereljensis TaxID=571912 RepID=A0A919NNX0_9ACTN|nr:hypothetical protein [Actinoplanes tereljensis]GIF22359.1 hypothetical protein Ate02nite_50890 [Actinoplanes tereljensis]